MKEPRRTSNTTRDGLPLFARLCVGKVANTACFVLVVLAACCAAVAQTDAPYVSSSQPELFTYNDLATLSQQEPIDPALADRLHTLLTTPFVNNEAYLSGVAPRPINPDGKGPTLHLIEWNIERGLELDNITLLMTDKRGFLAKVHESAGKNDGSTAETEKKLETQIDALQSADVIVLNEVDWGVKRTDYKPVVKELADALKMNWAYGVEFVEIDPKQLGLETFANVEDAAERKELTDAFSVDKDRVRGLHGSAILSRYPIRHVELKPFLSKAYDWYNGEKKYGTVEAGKRKAAGIVLGEELVREVRRGGRTNLIATLDIPDLAERQITIVATHLENRTTPKGRVKQLDELLSNVRAIRNPVLIAGEMNTTGMDGSVFNIKAATLKKISNPSFWASKGIKYATGVGFGMDIAEFAFKTTRFQGDPTASGVPLLAPNREQGLFKDLEKYRFDDGTRIDFSGDSSLSINGRSGTLGNSNERAAKGFETTFAPPRTLGVKGKLKLDWIFVKTSPLAGGGAESSSPRFARTMNEVNEALKERLSDHAPISVDILLAPSAPSGAHNY